MNLKYKFGDGEMIYKYDEKTNTFNIGYIGIKEPDNADVLPANGHDICNYFARHDMTNYQIQTVLKFDGRINFDKLVRAVRLSIDEEPVLGCRFMEDDPPYWKRLHYIDEAKLCSMEETENPEKVIRQFVESQLDMDEDPMVKVKLIRSGANDAVCIKLNHTFCDGAGAKEYTQLLSKIYSAIDPINGTFVPKQRIGGSKDQKKLFEFLDIKNPTIGWNPLKDAPTTPWVFPWLNNQMESVRFAMSRLPQGQLDSISEFGKSKGATVNDLILAAFYRAMFKISQPLFGIPMDISETIDLRRYLPDQRTEAIRNLSGGFKISMARVFGESFQGTLSRVMHEMKRIKSGNPGLQNAIGGECVETMNFPLLNKYMKSSSRISNFPLQSPVSGIHMRCTPTLSNLGLISKSLIQFGESVVADAYLLPPVVRAPGFLLFASSYNGIMTLAIGYYKGSIHRKDVERLLNKITGELVEGCIEGNMK